MVRLPLRTVALLLLIGSSPCALFAQQPPASANPKDPVARNSPETQIAQQATPSRLSVPGSVAISPDGTLVAWTLRGNQGSSIHLSDPGAPSGPVAGKQVTIPGASACAYSSPFWSPDSQMLAFLSDCAPLEGTQHKGQLQVYLWSRATGQTRQLTHLTGEIQQPVWSPKGKSIAFLFVENATRSAGALDAMKPWSGVIGEEGIEVQGVYIVSVADGHGHMFTRSDQHVFEFTWSPSGEGMAWIAAPPPGENNWWVAKLFVQPSLGMSLACLETGVCLKDGGPPSPALTAVDPNTATGPLHGLQIAVPRFSPDGKHIAFIGGLMSDQGSTGGDIYTVDVSRLDSSDGSKAQPVDVTPNIDGTPSWEGWFDNHSLGFVEDCRGHTLLVAWDINAKKPYPQPDGITDLGEVSVSGGPIKDAVTFSGKTDTAAFVQTSFNHPPEIWLETGGHTRQLTHLNDGLAPSARTESVEWTNGPFHVQGWLTFPAHYDPSHKYPIIVQVHGGPSASVTARWSDSGNSFADHGYFEFQPNPRGSFGQGEAFTEANRKDFGYGDLKDIEAGLDFLEAKYPVDHTREGLTGWSYGGFMTMFAVTQTHRFRAAVTGAGISDWLSYYGENSIDQWMLPFFGASVYDDPAVYEKSSAITFIKNVTTPTLVIVGDRDGECPAPQSFEFWHALRDHGTKTQLVVYPNEGHGFKDPSHIKDRNERILRWFAENMPPG